MPLDAHTPESTTTPFDAVPAPLQPALLRRGFSGLTSVQEAVLADEARGRDLRISSQTGSGKTVALGIAVSEVLLAESGARVGPEVLVVAPTRELAQQVSRELEWLYADERQVQVDCVTGGTPVIPERRRLSRDPRVLVGTPGRLLDHIQSGALDVSGVRHLVLDEADQMLDLGFRDELDGILDTTPRDRTTHLVSATFPPDVVELSHRYQNDAYHVEGTQLGAANEDIEHIGYLVGNRQRHGALINILLLAGDTRTLVFVRTRMEAAQIAEKLAKDGFSAQPISGDLAQSQRTRTLNAFRRGNLTTLVATDVAARGLDIPDVGTVVHHNPPMDAGTFTHRSGRTGRAGQKGRSILLASPNQRRKLEYSLAETGIDVKWSSAPNAEEVSRALQGNARKHVEQIVDAGTEHDEGTRAFAQKLLDGRDPEDVVASLLHAATPKPARRPVEIDSFEGRDQRRDRRDSRDRGHNDYSRPPRHGQNRRSRDDQPMARFELSWGSRHGASPARVLAHLCRRADCDRQAFGDIDIGSFSTHIEVREDFASAFAERTHTPDPRDPDLRIRRAHGEARPKKHGGKGGFQRDNRRGGFQRDNRKGGYQRDDRKRGGYQRDDRKGGGYQRDDRKSGGYQRDDRKGGGYQRDDRKSGGYQRDDRKGGGYKRDDRPKTREHSTGYGQSRDGGSGGGFGKQKSRKSFGRGAPRR